MSAQNQGWVPGDGFREWAYRKLIEAEIEKVESKVRYTIDDVVRFGRPHFANALEARLAIALAGTVTRFVCEPVAPEEFDAFIAERIARNHRNAAQPGRRDAPPPPGSRGSGHGHARRRSLR